MSGKVRRVDFSPDEYISGVAGVLRADEQGIYWMVCSLIMSEAGPIERNDRRLATLCMVRPADAKRIIDRLLEIGKIQLIDGKLGQKRAQNEVELASKRIQTASENGSKGGRPTKITEQNQQSEKPDGLSGAKLSPTTNYQPPSTEDSSLRSLGPTIENDDVKLAFEDWNTLADFKGLPRAKTITATRKASIRQRLSECGGIEGWRDALRLIPQSPFLMGENNSGFTATLDFVLQASSFTKLREGNYNKRGNGPATKISNLDLLDQQLREEIENERNDRTQGADTQSVPRLSFLSQG